MSHPPPQPTDQEKSEKIRLHILSKCIQLLFWTATEWQMKFDLDVHLCVPHTWTCSWSLGMSLPFKTLSCTVPAALGLWIQCIQQIPVQVKLWGVSSATVSVASSMKHSFDGARAARSNLTLTSLGVCAAAVALLISLQKPRAFVLIKLKTLQPPWP